MREVTTTNDVGIGGHVADAFIAATHNRLPHQVNAEWPSNGWSEEAELEMSAGPPGHRGQALFTLEPNVIGYVSVQHGGCNAWVSAQSPERAEWGLEHLRELVPRSEDADESQVSVTFWSYGRQGPQSVRRDLSAPAWSEIAENYPDRTREELARLLDGDFRPGVGGQLLLWHGEPGTGKTTSLRALAREWREWASLHYIADPEKFFGDHADYMLSVMLGFDNVDSEDWRVLVLEDTGELLQADARAQTGQALSRFLNAVDGLIGQGLRVLVLVTTNEKVERLHAAVARPGRCAASVEYDLFAGHEALKWFAAHGVDTDQVESQMTLAELYARVEGFEGATAREAVGFA